MRLDHALCLALICLAPACTPTEPEPPGCEVSADSWQPGQLAFRDASSDWGIEAPDVLGVRVAVTDIDSDGWPDLVTRRGGGPDVFSSDPELASRSRWLLWNNGEGSFEDVTEESRAFEARLDGTAGGRPGEVLISVDVDNDGDLDILTASNRSDITSETSETTDLALNDGNGNFTLAPDNDAFLGTLAVPVGATFSDVDLDGVLDLFVSNNKRGDDSSPLQDRLFLGLGDGTFVEATAAAELTTSQWSNIDTLNEAGGHSWGWGAVACDLNNDGLPELLSASYGRAPNHLWQAEEGGDLGVSFRNRSVESGYGYDERLDWWSNVNAQCYCFDNPEAEDCDLAPDPDDYGVCQALFAGFGGTYRWSHSGDREPWRLGGNSATTTCADINNDGFLDLFTGEIVHWDVGNSSDPAEVLFNAGQEDVRFERPGNEAMGFVRDDGSTWDHGDMSNAVLDFDNDGRQDIYISNSDYPGARGLLFHQQADGTFEPVDIEDGIDHLRSAGAAPVDLDRDGDLDLVVGHSRMRCGGNYSDDCYEQPIVRVFENLADDRNEWIQLRLEGAGGSNRSAVGARVTVKRCEETLTRSVDGGHGHQGSQEDMVLHFGLGSQQEAEVTIHWPDLVRSTQTFTVSTGAFYDVRQGEDPVEWSP